MVLCVIFSFLLTSGSKLIRDLAVALIDEVNMKLLPYDFNHTLERVACQTKYLLTFVLIYVTVFHIEQIK